MMRAILLSLALALAACGPSGEITERVEIKTTLGDILLELYPQKAPLTTANFMRYADERLYEGASFYRATRPDNDPMIRVIQGGLWRPWDEGGDEDFAAPLPTVVHETTAMSGLSHGDGVISMARDKPGTASSEFFITLGDNTSLDFGGARNPDGQGFAAFGRVIEGMDVVAAINAAPTQEGEGFAGQLLAEPVRIISVRRK